MLELILFKKIVYTQNIPYSNLMNLYMFHRAVSSKNGMAATGSLLFFAGMLLIFQPSEPVALCILAIMSMAFGLIVSKSLHTQMGSLLVTNMSKEQFESTRKFAKMLKYEQIPETKTEKIKYIEYINNLERVFDNSAVRRPIGLLFPLLAAMYLILFIPGWTFIKLIAIFLVLVLSFSFMSTRKTEHRTKSVKRKLGIL